MHLIIYLFSFWASLFQNSINENTDNVISVTITGIKEDKGTVRLGLFKRAEDFPITGKQYKGFLLDVKNKKAHIHIHNIPSGKYAIGAIHDINKNQRLDKNIFGYPIEPYGFSNNARGTFSAPTFESAMFSHNGKTELTIKVY